MNNTICQPIVSYEGNGLYSPIKINGVWVDQCGQQIRKTFKKNIKCPCKQYLNENCDTNYKSKLLYETNNITYFIQKHIDSGPHKMWLKHKNEQTSSLEEKSTNELVERIEELERNMRKDKVDFRVYLELKEKEFHEAIKHKDEALKHKDELIEALKKKPDN
tara:strand:+ start:86 stop:571 length:486 start_codon:yes stop_codon:yes gene_type:complete